METYSSLRQAILSLTILITFSRSLAKQTQPIYDILPTDELTSTRHQWRTYHDTQLKLTGPMMIAGVLCVIAASISSAGGIGGGGLFIPILTIVAGYDLKTASSFSAFMVTGGSLANVVCQMVVKNLKLGGKTLIDFDIALLSEPCMLLGVSGGVICNLVFPEWLITVLFAIFLAWSTLKTCKCAVLYWKLESEEGRRNGFGKLERGLVGGEICGGNGSGESTKVPLLTGESENCKLGIPRVKLGVLIMIWLSFFLLHFLRGDRHGQGIIPIEPCGVGYWVLSALQIPLAITFTTWILHRRESLQNQTSFQQETGPSNKLTFPVMALLAGGLGGVFGLGGGMLISPILLQVGIAPEVTAATCSFMVFFSATMSSIQYLLLGMDHIYAAIFFALLCFVASLVGLMVVQRAVEKHGRASLIVFSVGTVMALSTVLITSFGALDVWRDYTNGRYMGFKPPCL
ncbi:sulfite exporter TauE/SafE family protein 5-like [Actinidia eriantha]|uniref:sulfite exporter TauE/SafE family protein 5-like n=1 Tax=Actinidia eriantha TaxID=165200 RepID=UPI00258F8B3C|nr:sulfite exporter TauE/SafE family protein 5-like [Actinidia eriantha]